MSSCSSGKTLATPRRGRRLRQRGLRTCTLWFVEARNKSPWPFFLALVGAQLAFDCEALAHYLHTLSYASEAGN